MNIKRGEEKNSKKINCSNKEIRKETIEAIVLSKLTDVIFDDCLIGKIHSRINDFIEEKEGSVRVSKTNAENRLREITRQINSLVDVIADTGSKTILQRLDSLEKEKLLIEDKIQSIDNNISSKLVSEDTIKKLFIEAKNLFEQGTLDSTKKLIDLFVEKVYVYKDSIEIILNILPTDNPPKARKDDKNLDELFNFGKINISAKRIKSD